METPDIAAARALRSESAVTLEKALTLFETLKPQNMREALLFLESLLQGPGGGKLDEDDEASGKTGAAL